jgi:ABC-2 type transport system ATP-binding protein
MIEIHALTKRYGRTTAVSDLTFTVRPGVVTGFLGPNGAGKSTTMRMILGLDAPTRGTVAVHGRPYAELPAPMREVGALLDARAVHGGRRARDHLLCLCQSNGLPGSRVNEVLQLVGLVQVARRRIRTFSLGMLQRLGIAAAMLGDPGILMFDEPMNGLDPEGIVWIRKMMHNLAAEGRTVLVSSHLMNEMAVTVNHLIVIGRGRLIADSGIREFVSAHASDRVIVRTPNADRFAWLLGEAGAKVSYGPDESLVVSAMTSADIGALAFRKGVMLHELAPQRTSLEDAFLEMTRDSTEFTVTEGAA